MADLPKISDEEMDELVKLFRAGHAAPPVPSTPDERIRAGLAVALVGSGYRPEADVLRRDEENFFMAWEAAAKLLDGAAKGARQRGISQHYAEGWADAADVLAETVAEMRAQRQATALDPAQPLPVAAVEGQERSEGPVMVPCECPDPRCTNRIAILLVGDEESDRG